MDPWLKVCIANQQQVTWYVNPPPTDKKQIKVFHKFNAFRSEEIVQINNILKLKWIYCRINSLGEDTAWNFLTMFIIKLLHKQEWLSSSLVKIKSITFHETDNKTLKSPRSDSGSAENVMVYTNKWWHFKKIHKPDTWNCV